MLAVVNWWASRFTGLVLAIAGIRCRIYGSLLAHNSFDLARAQRHAAGTGAPLQTAVRRAAPSTTERTAGRATRRERGCGTGLHLPYFYVISAFREARPRYGLPAGTAALITHDPLDDQISIASAPRTLQ